MGFGMVSARRISAIAVAIALLAASCGDDLPPATDGAGSLSATAPDHDERARSQAIADAAIAGTYDPVACGEPTPAGFRQPLDRDDILPVYDPRFVGADGVDWSPEANAKAAMLENDPKYADFATMMVKTHESLSHDRTIKAVPKGWRLPVRDVLIYSGAKFLCPCAGTISLMPGTGSNPAFRRVDVDVETGKVSGLF